MGCIIHRTCRRSWQLQVVFPIAVPLKSVVVERELSMCQYYRLPTACKIDWEGFPFIIVILLDRTKHDPHKSLVTVRTGPGGTARSTCGSALQAAQSTVLQFGDHPKSKKSNDVSALSDDPTAIAVPPHAHALRASTEHGAHGPSWQGAAHFWFLHRGRLQSKP